MVILPGDNEILALSDIPEYLHEIYLEGYEARTQGIYECPYENIIPLRKVWAFGWSDRDTDFNQEADFSLERELDRLDSIGDQYSDPFWEQLMDDYDR